MFAQVLTLLVPAGLILFVLLPRPWANAKPARIREWVAGGIAMQLMIAGLCLIPLLFNKYRVDLPDKSLARSLFLHSRCSWYCK